MTKPWPHQNWSWPIRVGVATSALALVVVLGRVLVITPSAEAHAEATFTVLYSFKYGTDGGIPDATLVRDATGNLYGTTRLGGNPNCTNGCGTVFKLDTTGTETVLYSFAGPPLDGNDPQGSLVRDAAGNLYGTTRFGGINDFGTVFKIDTAGNETVLHSFNGRAPEGRYPNGLVRGVAGSLYGNTEKGGAPECNPLGCGTVFKLHTTGKETVLYSFAGVPDGESPLAGVILDGAGNLYGTTDRGGTFNSGTVFKLDTTGKENVLYSFTGGPDGQNPFAGLVRDAAGNLYGTTESGGASEKGTVFKLDTTGAETVLHSFGAGATDGMNPGAGLLRDAAGNLYGTTQSGGANDMGTLFKVDGSGKLTILHSFNGTDGAGLFLRASLIRDAAGNLYGTTPTGGAFNVGTVFKLSR
jgi:uncharacterized repeat protein (TIGR03803 family)